MGSDIDETLRQAVQTVSIHAPTWGATHRCLYIGGISKFQSTLPHGERPRQSFPIWYSFRSFNPRSHMGSDGCQHILIVNGHRFNPRSHMGSDTPHAGLPRPISSFNPRSHMGSDRGKSTTQYTVIVSIHAPTWGATSAFAEG